ncbi:MAG TPA: transcription termination factor Rho [Actinomycetota bacterium]|nr:transcription termination factor Rho [Actinomycetota bacterium]
MDKSALEGKVAAELHQMATDLGIEGHQRLKKADLIDSILAHENGEAATGGARDRTATGEAPPVETAAPTDAGGNGEVTSELRPAPATETATQAASETATETRELADRDRRPDAAERTDRGQRDRTERQDRPERQERHERPEGQRPEGGRRRPSREERRRQREERRQREFEMREEELANAPTATGLLDILPEGYGFLRTSGFLPGQQDIYVSLSQVRRFMLRKGDTVTGKVRQPKDNEKYFALLQIDTVNDLDPETAKSRPVFEKLTPLFPHDRFRLETGPTDVTGRIIDMVAPIGKGQRGMVVSPPKAGKTTVLKNIANGIISSSPETHVIILLVDERPEEVTDWQRTVTPAEVVYSTFDKPPDQHIQVTELVLERAKRLAEMGRDVAIILDSITRLARAYNLAAPASGKILSGGIDSTALYPPRRFFGAARNIEEGGSLTIIASALVETGSRMDEGIFEEFKGTGNMELRLDRQLSEKRLFPAINVEASGTRKEELLMPTEELALVWRLRRVLHALEPAAALELLTDKIRTTKSNEQFLKEIEKVKA